MSSSSRTISDDRLSDLPIFPLPNCHLFPGAVLPLNVFEPRYRELVEHALKTEDKALAVATLKPGFDAEYEGTPPIYAVMGAGIIMAADQLPDGRWNLLVRGTDRVRLVEELPSEHSYRTIRAERLQETLLPDSHPLEERLRALLNQLADQAPAAREALHLILSNADTGSELADLLGAHACSDPDLRRRMLECTNVERRLSIACRHIGRLLLEILDPPAGGKDTLH